MARDVPERKPQPDWSKAVAHAPGQPPLLPMVCQNALTGQVLMLGYVNEEAWEHTLELQEVVFWSRSQGKLWRKGETSGHTLKLKAVRLDCDADTILALVEPQGPTCHRHSTTCFDLEKSEGGFENLDVGWSVASRLYSTILARASGDDPESYSYKLLQAGPDRVLKKLGEECTETLIAAKNATITGNAEEFCAESADLLYHWLVTLVTLGQTPEQVFAVLKSREGGPRRGEVKKI